MPHLLPIFIFIYYLITIPVMVGTERGWTLGGSAVSVFNVYTELMKSEIKNEALF